MPGLVVTILVGEGQEIKKGQVLLILELMKMQNELKSPRDGTVGSNPCEGGRDGRTKANVVECDVMSDSGQETEAKFYVQDLEHIQSYLERVEARLVQARVLEKNLRFDLPDGSLRPETRLAATI